MGMKGNICTFTTRCLTDEEYQQCCHIILSDEDNWYTSAKIFNISDMEEEIRYSVGRASTPSRDIIFVYLNSNSLLPPVAENRDNFNIHNFD